jgi:hypothetical protein
MGIGRDGGGEPALTWPPKSVIDTSTGPSSGIHAAKEWLSIQRSVDNIPQDSS